MIKKLLNWIAMNIRVLALKVLIAGVFSVGARAAEIDVVLKDPPEEGTVVILFYDSENSFGDLRDPFRVEKFTLDGREFYRVSKLPEGNYAMLVYFDENGNDQIDKNFIGIPREPLGFSNGYRPKGPPSYSRAAFDVGSDEKQRFEVALYRPLGKLGRVGVGVGVIGRSSPYRGYEGSVSKVIPAITYTGEKLRIFGPNLEYGIFGSGDVRLALNGQYRLGVYEEDDSAFLAGMGDREGTFMAGLSLNAELDGGFELSLGYLHDVLGKIGGGEGKVGLSKSFQFGVFRLSPYLAGNWMSEDLADHDFGVSVENALIERFAYDVGSVLSYEVGTGAFIEITENWLFVMNIGYEFLPSEVTNSPIVVEEHVVKGFGAINFAF